jgi:NADP-dependent 3-hydroxy acid dehydrogenase YdfG
MSSPIPSPEFHRPVVWVTGASRGIGAEIANQFASIGCEVCLSARSRPELQKIARGIRSLGGRAHVFPLDVTNRKQIGNIAASITRRFGRVDVLVNNAGITVFKTFFTTTMDDVDAIIETNLTSHIACTKAVLPAMIRRKSGWVFNILSYAAVKTFEESAAYTAAKAGMHGFGKVLREEMRIHNVKVVNVLPGSTETAMWSRAMRKKYSHQMMKPESVAEAVLSVYQLPNDVVVDDIILRPVMGDID